MSAPNSSLGNVISRLQGLKNVSGNSRRRVMPGAEFLEEQQPPPQDVSGTAPPLPEFANFMPTPQNQPESDLGGELTPQSYDVRANSVQAEPEAQSSGFWSKIGSALADYVNPQKRQEMSANNQAMMNRAQTPAPSPPVETAQVDMQEGLPPVTAQQQEQPGGIWDWIKNEAQKPYGAETAGNLWQGTKNLVKENFTPSIAPETYEQFGIQKPPAVEQEQQQQKQLDQEQMDQAQMQPWQVAAYGATDAFANSPELVSQYEEYTGTEFDEAQKEMTEKYERVISDLEKGNLANDAQYDEQERRIKERILNNQSNDADKYYIGLALLMPLLIGGFFGKEAGLGALGGGAKGIADVLGQRQKDIRSDEESLSDIYKQRSTNQAKKGELEIEKLKIPQTVQKNLPKNEYEDLKGMKIYTFKDPKTGEVLGGGPEVLPDLYLDMNYGNTAKKREGMQEKASKLEEEKAALERANQATSDVIHAAMQLKDPGVFGKIMSVALSDDDNGALKKLVRQNAPMIKIDGRNQNTAVYIDSKIEQIKDAYRRNEQMKAFTQTVASHIGSMAENPQYSGLKPQDLIDQMLILRDRGQQFFVDRAGSQGFIKQPLENKFGKLNRQLYSALNSKEEKSQLERDKQLMYGSE
jgi:hypothetical protein